MLKGSKGRVFVGMSGGVDSSVTALLLQERGYDVVGVFMRCYNVDGCAERDAEDARRVAEHIGIPFYVWDFEEEYKRRVVDYMVEGYREGITPNPDVMCNREIKFGLFLKKALAMGADHVATGHYVRLKRRNGHPVLYAANDATKDQSYFLWTLTEDELKYCIFPIGELKKTEVRSIAKKAGLSTAEKKDSQGICFLGDISIKDFLKDYIPERRGALVTTSGEQVGEHFGAEFYTIGERHINAEFKFPKTGGARPRKPFYVARKDALTNTVILAEGNDDPELYKKEVMLTGVNLRGSRSDQAGTPLPVLARVRYRQPLARATLERLHEQGAYRLIFKQPQRFVASGQSAAFYSETGEMLGGAMIL